MKNESSFTPDDETRGLAFASYSLINALLSVLEKKGIFTEHDVQDVFDTTLTALEHRYQDNSIDIARRLIEGAVIGRATSRPKGSTD